MSEITNIAQHKYLDSDTLLQHLLFIVTYKYNKNKAHDPKNKISSPCKTSESCSDSTGSHHSGLLYALSLHQLQVYLANQDIHVTRIELVPSAIGVVPNE